MYAKYFIAHAAAIRLNDIYPIIYYLDNCHVQIFSATWLPEYYVLQENYILRKVSFASETLLVKWVKKQPA